MRTSLTARSGTVPSRQPTSRRPRSSEDVFDRRIRRRPSSVTVDDAVGEVSGLVAPDRPHPPACSSTSGRDDLAAAVLRVEPADGSLERRRCPSGELTAWFREPAGNVLGLLQEPTAP